MTYNYNNSLLGDYLTPSGNSLVVENPIIISSGSINGTVIGNLNPSSGYFTNLFFNGIVVSVSGHTHTSSDITNFNSAVSGLLPVKDIIAGSGIGVVNTSGNYTISASGLTSNNITNFNSAVSGLLPVKDIIAGSGIGVVNTSGNYTISASGLTSNNITNFNSAVSGLLPVKDIIAGSGIGVVNTSGNYTISASGLTSNNITNFNSAVSGLLPVKDIIAGSGIGVVNTSGNYTISASGLTSNNITNFNSAVSGLLPVKDIIAGSGIGVVNTSGNYTISASGLTSNNITNFNSAVSGLLPVKDIIAGSGIGVVNTSGNYTISASGLTSNNITNFNSAVSGLLPVKDIIAGSGVNIINTSGVYSVAITGTFGLDTEQVDDRVASLLVPGSGINIIYDDPNNKITISTAASAPVLVKEYELLVSNKNTFTVSSGYIIGYLEVYFNGVKLINGLDYTATDGISFILAQTGNSGDTVEWLALSGYGSYLPFALEQFDDRMSELLVAGTGIQLSYDDPNNNLTISVTGISFVNHTHSSSDITNFNSEVSGLLPTISNSGDNRLLTSTGSSVGINAESNLIFDGTTLSIPSGYINVSRPTDGGSTLNVGGVGIFGEASDIVSIGNDMIGGELGLSTLTEYLAVKLLTDSSLRYGGTDINPAIIISSGLNIGIKTNSPNYSLDVSGSGNFSDSLFVSGIPVSISGHTHTSSNITNFNSSVSGLLPSVTGSGYINSSFTNNTYTISVTGLQPSGNYSIVGHTHTSSDITNFNTAVSGLLPVKDITSGTGISVSSISGIYTINSTISSVAESASLVTNVFNQTATTIVKGSVVYINGGQGDQPTIQLAIATNEGGSSKTYGVVQSDIPTMSLGKVVVAGAFTGFNTDQYNPTAPTGDVNGTTLWLSPTVSGTMTTTKPSAPYHMVSVGTIVRTHQNQGIIEVRVQNGFELEELHNVAISGVTSGQFLQYNSGTQLWVPSSSGNFTTLQLNGTGVSVNGHTHNASDITNFNSSVSGLLPSVSGTGYITSNFTNNIYTISVTGLQPSGNYSVVGHTHTSANITDFNSSVSGLLPTIANSDDNRLLTSTGSSLGINAESGLTFDGSTLNVDGNLVFDSFTESVVAIGNSSTSQTLSLANGTVQTCTLTGNCTFTMPTTTAGKSFTMFLNSGSGNYTASFSGVLWNDSSPPTITTTASKVDIFSFISDGSYWYGSYSQNYGS